jgi:hypothetical protein
VIFCHNKIQDELVHIAGKALTPSAVRDKPLICPCRNVEKVNPCPATQTNAKPASKEDRGDILLRGFWARGTNCIVDFRVTNTDAKSYGHHDPAKVIATQEREKKRKYLEPCLKQRRHFTPFVCSTNGLLGPEAETFASNSQQSCLANGKRLICKFADMSKLV